MDIVNILIGDLEPISFMVGVIFAAPFWYYWGTLRNKENKQHVVIDRSRQL